MKGKSSSRSKQKGLLSSKQIILLGLYLSVLNLVTAFLYLGGTTPLGSIVDQKFIDTHNRLRLNKDSIKKSMFYHSDYHMKVVVNPVEMPETWAEIRSFMDELEVPKDKIWIMPPGDNRQELIRVYPMVIDWCTENYYNFTGREHIIAFDTKREV
jgi:7-carboxy-7-deazaguanine synthase